MDFWPFLQGGGFFGAGLAFGGVTVGGVAVGGATFAYELTRDEGELGKSKIDPFRVPRLPRFRRRGRREVGRTARNGP